MNHLRLVRMAVLGVAVCAAATASAAFGKDGGSTVSFTAIGPAGLRIVGTTPDLSVADDGQQVEIKVPLANLTTGIGLRDSHMRDKYLQVGTYPDARLVVPRAALQLPADGADGDATGTGMMTLHGQSRPIAFHYKLSRRGQKIAVTGDMPVNMNNFGITTPGYLGLSVKPDVTVSVQFSVSDH
jgi:polyisoprenoid-binding protein YceI